MIKSLCTRWLDRARTAVPAVAAGLCLRARRWLDRDPARWPLVGLLPALALVGGIWGDWSSDEPPGDPLHCLAEAIYFEARGEPWEGQLAVANVVLNRVAHPKFPRTVCGVVRARYQFSYYWDGKPETVDDLRAWAEAWAIARMATDGVVLDGVQDATFYHADYVAPKWAERMTPVSKVGRHLFYRM